MENTKKRNIFSNIINKIKKLDEELGVDIPDNNKDLTEAEKAELEMIEKSDHVEEIVKKYNENDLRNRLKEERKSYDKSKTQEIKENKEREGKEEKERD